MRKTNYRTRPPAQQYDNCSCCGVPMTVLAFAGLTYRSQYTTYTISLCGDCAKQQVKIMLDITCEGSSLTQTLEFLTKKGGKSSRKVVKHNAKSIRKDEVSYDEGIWDKEGSRNGLQNME